jgi:hypothetical protein
MVNQFAFISFIAWQLRPGLCADDRICRPWWDKGRLIVSNNCCLIAFDMPTPPKFITIRDASLPAGIRPPQIDNFLAYCEGVHGMLPLPEIAGPTTVIRTGWRDYSETRTEIAEAYELIAFRGLHFRREFLWILSQLPGLMTFPPVPEALTLPFVFDGGRGCLMPVVDEDQLSDSQVEAMAAAIQGEAVAAAILDDNAVAAAVSLAEDEAGVGP